jgi:ACS family sodium-dependent inorganic phosphate cotransporter
MAKFTSRAENFRFFLQNNTDTVSQRPVFKASVLKLHHLHSFPSRHRSEFRICCTLKEKENVKESERVPGVLTGLRVNESEHVGSEGETGSGEVWFDWNWPPWKNVPERYKFIGTTSLAFVICNMDKVFSFFFSFFLFAKRIR